MKDDRQKQTAETLVILAIIAMLLLFIHEASSQTFNFQLSGGVAEVHNVNEGASLFYSIGVGYVAASNLGVTLKGRRSYFERQYPQDNYDAVVTYKVVDHGVYDLVALAGVSYIRSPFYLNNGFLKPLIPGFFSPVVGFHNLIAVDDLLDINFYVEATSKKQFITYVGLGFTVNLVFKTEKRAKRFF